MKYKLYTTSEKVWADMLIDLKNAESSIYWESFIFIDSNDDPLNQEIFKILSKKAQTGVVVKIIADYLGSFSLSDKAKKNLEKAGAEVIFWSGFNFWKRNHKKILIIDEKIAFIGGVNLAKDHRHWLDLHLRLSGIHLINYLLNSFRKTYYLSNGKDKLNFKNSKFSQRKIRFIEHWPFKKRRTLKKHYVNACLSAENNIIIATPYFAPHNWLIKILHQAAKRGVKIDIIIPKRTDKFLINIANYVFASLVYKTGINFYFSQNFIHAKALLIDEREGLIGSQNIDAASFDYNIESGIVFERQDMIKNLKTILEKWKNNSQLLNFNKDKKWHQRLLEVVFQLLQPIL